MNRNAGLMLFLLSSIAGVPLDVAFADSCEIAKVSWSGIFGNGIEIGDPYKKVVSRVDPKQQALCQRGDNPLRVDCTVVDSRGIEYMIADGIVVRIEATAQVVSASHLTVAGVRGDQNDSSLVQIAAHIPVGMTLGKSATGSIVATTGLCLEGKSDVFELFFEYTEKGALVRIGARTDSI